MSSEEPMIYQDKVLSVVDMYSDTALNIQNITGVSSSVVLGSILEEYNDRHETLPDLLSQKFADYWSTALNNSHEAILENYNYVQSKGADWRTNLSTANKLLNPVMIDVGVGNIQLYTAIGLLDEYNQKYQNSDPLELKQYNSDYNNLVNALSNTFNNATVKFASLMIEKGLSWGAHNISNWDTLSGLEQEAFAVYFYNVGEEYVEDRRATAIAENGAYNVDIDNTDIAQEYLQNYSSIVERMLPGNERLSGLRELIASGQLNDDTGYCFLAGTQISMWDGSKKPIEDIRPDDIVTSYDENGNLVPGRVKRTKTNRAKHILDFHGLMVTPGHAFYCADGKFKGQHVPVLDILRSDGAIQKEDGTIIRAATNCRVGSLEDQFVWVLAGPDNGNTITVTDKAQLRLGTKALLPDGSTRSILDGLIEIYGPVDKMGFCKDGQNVLNHVFHWPFGDKLPKPEDYVLKISALTTQDIYQHSEWEQAFPPRLPAPLQGEAGGSFKQDPVLQASAAPNIPLSMRDSANQPSMSRKQRRAQEAKQRKESKARPKTLH